MNLPLNALAVAALLLAGCATPPDPAPAPPPAPEKPANTISATDCLWLDSSVGTFAAYADAGDLGMVVVNLRGISTDSARFATNYSGKASSALRGLSTAASSYADAIESGDFAGAGDDFVRHSGAINDLCQ